jgi:hypothetical protein
MISFGIHGVGLLLALILCVVSMALGIDWLTIGHGLHPALAFSITVLSAAAAAWHLDSIYQEYLDWAFD